FPTHNGRVCPWIPGSEETHSPVRFRLQSLAGSRGVSQTHLTITTVSGWSKGGGSFATNNFIGNILMAMTVWHAATFRRIKLLLREDFSGWIRAADDFF